MKYKPYTLKNYHRIPQLKNMCATDASDIGIVGRVLPFKTNNYVVDELINWDDYKNDPVFNINFPQKKLMDRKHFNLISDLVKSSVDDSIQ